MSTILCTFTSSALRNAFEFGIARSHPGTYKLVFVRAYGMAVTRDLGDLDLSSPPSTSPPMSTAGRPLLWLEASNANKQEPRGLWAGSSHSMYEVLITAEPAVIAPTGRTKTVRSLKGISYEAYEVELLLDEETLTRWCYYCGDSELNYAGEKRMALLSGQGYQSTYRCSQVSA
jgi:hypothetical protein